MAKSSFDEEYDRAVRAAAEADEREPRARSVRYDRQTDRVVVELRNGASFLFPPALAQGLAGASPEDLADVEISPSGAGLHWPSLDADFSLPALMMGVFGTPAWMAEVGRRGASVRSAKKAEAMPEHDKKGGRAPKARPPARKSSKTA